MCRSCVLVLFVGMWSSDRIGPEGAAAATSYGPGPSPAAHGLAIAWTDLAVMALWAAVGLAVALRRFRWLPRASRTA